MCTFFALAFCFTPPKLANGFIPADIKGISRWSIGSNITFKCGRSFILNGSATVTCQAGGTWSPSPTCEPTLNLLCLSICMFVYVCMICMYVCSTFR